MSVMEKKKRKVIKEKPRNIEIKEKDGTKKTVGKYDAENKIFTSIRKRSEHFLRKTNSWGIDQKVVEFLIEKRAKIQIKDSESKWTYECSAIEFDAHGHVLEFNQHRPQYFLPLEYWNVTSAKGRSCVIECLETDCTHNFGKNCFRGAIKIGKEGECTTYEDR